MAKKDQDFELPSNGESEELESGDLSSCDADQDMK